MSEVTPDPADPQAEDGPAAMGHEEPFQARTLTARFGSI